MRHSPCLYFSILWNDLVTTQNRTGLCAGTYTVTVTDNGGGCVGTFSRTITQPPAFAVVIDSIRNVGCNGEATGAIYIHKTANPLPFSIAINYSTALNLQDGITDGCRRALNLQDGIAPSCRQALNLQDGIVKICNRTLNILKGIVKSCNQKIFFLYDS